MSIRSIVAGSNDRARHEIARNLELTQSQQTDYEKLLLDARKRFARVILGRQMTEASAWDDIEQPSGTEPVTVHRMTFEPVRKYNPLVVLEPFDDVKGKHRTVVVEPEMIAPLDFDPMTLEGARLLRLSTRATLNLPEEAPAQELLTPGYYTLGEQILHLTPLECPLTLADSKNAGDFVASLREVIQALY